MSTTPTDGGVDLNEMLPYLLTGGVGAAAGGYLASRKKRKKGEGRARHLSRILGNALLAGGMAAGGHALLRRGLSDVAGAGGAVDTIKNVPDSPARSGTRTLLTNPLTGAASSIATLAVTDKLPMIGADRAGTLAAKNLLAGDLTSKHVHESLSAAAQRRVAARTAELYANARAGGTLDAEASKRLKEMMQSVAEKEMGKVPGADSVRATIAENLGRKKVVIGGEDFDLSGRGIDRLDSTGDLRKLRQRAGVGIEERRGVSMRDPAPPGAPAGTRGPLRPRKQILKDMLDSNLSRKGLMSTLGQSRARRIGRTGVGAIGLLLPSLISSYVTDTDADLNRIRKEDL
jgi:hypothetical protein